MSKQIKNTLKSTISNTSNNNTYESTSNNQLLNKKSEIKDTEIYSNIKAVVPGTDGQG